MFTPVQVRVRNRNTTAQTTEKHAFDSGDEAPLRKSATLVLWYCIMLYFVLLLCCVVFCCFDPDAISKQNPDKTKAHMEDGQKKERADKWAVKSPCSDLFEPSYLLFFWKER